MAIYSYLFVISGCNGIIHSRNGVSSVLITGKGPQLYLGGLIVVQGLQCQVDLPFSARAEAMESTQPEVYRRNCQLFSLYMFILCSCEPPNRCRKVRKPGTMKELSNMN